MSSELAAWLRRQREDRGWTRTELARQLIRAARARGDTSLPGTDNISHNIYRWERGTVAPAERYKLLYCSAFGIPFSQFGPGRGRGLTPGMVDTGPAARAASAYGGTLPPERGASAIRREVLMAAHEGSAHAEGVEQRGIGEATLEQFRADVTQLAVQYLTGETFGLFTEMRRVRNRITEALGRRQWPRDAAELYLLAGCLSALMAAAAVNLGYPQAAGELTRAGWAYATGIDHRPLMARLGCARPTPPTGAGTRSSAPTWPAAGSASSPTARARRSCTCSGGWPRPAAATPPARARPSRPPATPGTASTTTSCSRSAASSASPGRPRPTTRASSWLRRARSRPPPAN